MHIFSFRYLIVFSVLTITAFLEDAIRIFEECLPKIGEVKTCIQCVLSLSFEFFLFKGNRTGLKVNDQLATRFLAVRLKKYVWSHHRTLKAKVQCDFSSAYSPDHTD